MMTTMATLVALAAVSQYPDALDHLRAGDVIPQVGLLLDRSCSMADGALSTECVWFAQQCADGHGDSPWGWNYCSTDCPCDDFSGDCDSDAECKSGYCAHDVGPAYGQGGTMDVCEPHPSGLSPTTAVLNKRDQMKAVLVGCKNDKDGILDRWSERINFSLYEFGSGTTRRVPFDSSLATLEAGVMQIPASGSTHITRGLRDHSEYFDEFFDGSNTLECRPNFLVVLSDGNPNGGAATFDHECTAPVESRYVSANQPWLGADYLVSNPDVLCSVPGNQTINTYSIGFGAPGSFSPSNLQNIADYGGGDYYYASDVGQLNEAFDRIISTIVSKSALFFAPIAIQTESLFSGNYAYTASFKPRAGGPWRGTVKKNCVVPPILLDGSYDTSVDTCLFTSADGKELLTNPDVMDLWTGVRSVAADVGGAGEVLYDRLGTNPGGLPVAPYYDHRNIITWRPGASSFVSVDPSVWTRDDSWTNGCDHHRLLNWLHGYTYDADCNTGAPVSASTWAMGDPVNFAPVLLNYGPCEDASRTPIVGNCFVVAGMNDGMLHVFDVANGDETSALVPAELWKPTGVPTSPLFEVTDQPTLTFTHRYYVDGVPRLFHRDDDADGYIDSGETAHLVFGLGRGGRALYQIPVSELTGGVLDSTKNAPRPLLPTAGTSFAELQQTWAAPWLGELRRDGAQHDVAVFPSGHVGHLDIAPGPNDVAKVPAPPPLDLSSAQQVSCTGAGGVAAHNGQSDAWCSQYHVPSCAGTPSDPCYDPSGLPEDIAVPIDFDDGVYEAAALRVRLSTFDLGPNDTLRVEDQAGNVVGTYAANQLHGGWTPWVYGDRIVLRLLTDGLDSADHGYVVDALEWAPVTRGEASGQAPGRVAGYTLGTDHRPSVYVVDLDKWNGSAPTPYADAVTADGLVLRFTNDCNGLDGGKCIDASTMPDLADMVCPISAEVSAFTEAGRVRALYWGDECAQIWKAWTDDDGATWSAKRLVNLNGGQVGVSKDHRKIFRRLDLVLSTCPGQRVVGVYFGTGNIQSPTSKGDLADAAITNGRDLIGVVFDRAELPGGLDESDLEDVTGGTSKTAQQIIAEGKHGWRIELSANERMLRDPLVFDGTAFYKTFEPTAGALECGGGSGIDRIYSVSNCTGQPTQDLNGDGVFDASTEREVWAGETEIGGGLFFFTPKDSPVVVSHADVTTQQSARLNARTRTRPGLYLWREY